MMKQMTIKKKVTLWYTGIIALILGMVLVFMFYFVDKVGISATEEEVSAAVTGFSANFQFQDGTYYLSEDTQFYQDGVMFVSMMTTGNYYMAQCQRNFRSRRS